MHTGMFAEIFKNVYLGIFNVEQFEFYQTK